MDNKKASNKSIDRTTLELFTDFCSMVKSMDSSVDVAIKKVDRAISSDDCACLDQVKRDPLFVAYMEHVRGTKYLDTGYVRYGSAKIDGKEIDWTSDEWKVYLENGADLAKVGRKAYEARDENLTKNLYHK